MNIVLVHQYFKTPKDGGGIRSYYLADHLTKLGHNVQIITAYNEERYTIKQINNYKVHYLPIYYSNHLSFWSRIHAFWLFAYSTYRLIKKLRPIDLNYVISTPLTTGLIAICAKKRFKIPFIFEVGDLWPEAPIQLGVLKNSLLINLAKKLERNTYHHAQKIVALSHDIKKHISTKIPEKDISVITNMADMGFFESYIKPETKDFVIGYLGTFGLANHLEYLVEAAKCAPARVRFLLMGSGAQYDRIKALSRDLENIIWEDEGGKEKVKVIMNKCDAIYISFHKAPVLATGSPNKLFDGLAAGKYIIINFRGWVQELIESSECGVSYNPEKPAELFMKLEPIMKDSKKLNAGQLKARQLAQQFSPEVQLKALEQVIG